MCVEMMVKDIFARKQKGGWRRRKRERKMEMTLSHQLIRFHYDFSLRHARSFDGRFCSSLRPSSFHAHIRNQCIGFFNYLRAIEWWISWWNLRWWLHRTKSVHWLMMMECWTQVPSPSSLRNLRNLNSNFTNVGAPSKSYFKSHSGPDPAS